MWRGEAERKGHLSRRLSRRLAMLMLWPAKRRAKPDGDRSSLRIVSRPLPTCRTSCHSDNSLCYRLRVVSLKPPSACVFSSNNGNLRSLDFMMDS